MTQTWNIPALGDGVSEGVVAQLLVEVGQRVAAGDTLLEIETDKVVMEVPAPADGVIEAWLVGTGDTLTEGKAFARVSAAASAPSTSPSDGQSSEAAAGTEAADKADAASSAESSTASGARAEDSAPLAQADQAPPAAAADRPSSTLAAVTPSAATASGAADERSIAPAGPAARRLARELGVDLADVQGSGARGRISKDDIKRHVRERGTAGNTTGAMPGNLALPDLSQWGAVTQQPLDGIGRAVAGNMQRAWREVPHAWVSRDVPVDALEAARRRLRTRDPELPLTLTALLTRALAQALREFPRFNAAFDAQAQALVLRDDVHVGVAVDTPRGLMVPVLRNADRLSLRETATQLATLAEQARGGRLDPALLRGGCITISNLGGLGADGLMPVVNWPEVAILGVGAARCQPRLADGQLIEVSLLPLTLGFDHRVINGADAARLLGWLHDHLQEPLALAL